MYLGIKEIITPFFIFWGFALMKGALSNFCYKGLCNNLSKS